MITETHSPGPWRITRTETSPCSIESPKYPGAALAKVYLTNPNNHRREDEFALNACLIASAPALLAALQGLIEGDFVDQPRWRRAVDAVAQATGEIPLCLK